MPRVGLTRERIAVAAAGVADEVGLEKLTLAAVAVRCGVSVPGLFKHVAGLDAVKRDVAVSAVGEQAGVLAAATSGLAGAPALSALTAAYRSYAADHPGRYAASVRAPAPGDTEHAEAGGRAVTVIADALRGYDLHGSDLIHAVRMWRIACHGLVSLEAAGGFALAQSLDVTVQRLVDALDHSFRNPPPGSA